jgi:hypothetical protein
MESTVNASGDDGFGFSTPSFSTTGAVTVGITGGNSVTSWFRFPNINVPAGVTILSASVGFYSGGDSSSDLNIKIHGEKSNAPVAPSSYTDLTGRTLSTNFTAWTPGTWTTNQFVESPSLVNVVQELVDEFNGLNTLQLIVLNNSGTSSRFLGSQDSGFPAVLTIVYSTPTDIQFGTSFRSSLTGFYVLLDTLNFNESERRDVLYSDTRYGGKAINVKEKLTPVEFQCIVFGTTRDEMLRNSEKLANTITNPKGGLLEYLPDEATTTTYFTYEMSIIPKVSSKKLNRWDDIKREHNIHAMIFDVELMTHPFGHSRIFQAITPSQTTLSNSVNNHLDLLDIRGDVPALLQTKLTNLVAGQTLNKFYICSRSSLYSTLGTLVSSFEAEDAAELVGSWGIQVDAARSGGGYQRLSASDADWNRIVFDLPSNTQYEGLITILPVIRASSTSFKCRLAVYLNSTAVWVSRNQYSPELANIWHILYAGEFNFPPIALSSDFTTPLQLAIEFMLPSGSATLDVDFVQIMYSDESIMQVDIDTGRNVGATYGESLLLETGLDYIRKSLVLNDSDAITRYANSVYGTLSLLATKDTRLYVLFERLNGTHLPTDQVEVETNIIYRTTYPFRD